MCDVYHYIKLVIFCCTLLTDVIKDKHFQLIIIRLVWLRPIFFLSNNSNRLGE